MANIVASAAGGAWNTNGAWTGGVQPGTGDTAVFTAASGNVNIPASTTVAVGSVDFSGLGVSNYAGTFTFSASTAILTVGSATLGAVTFSPSMVLTLTGVGTLNLVGSTASTTYAFTTAGLVMPNININAGASTTIQHADNVTATGATITFTTGIHDWNSKTFTAAVYAGSGSATRSVLPGSGAMTLTSTGTAWSWATVTGLTVNATTATVTCSGAGTTFSSGSVSWNGLTVVFTGSGTKTFTVTTPTFGAVTVTGSANKTDVFSIGGNFTTTGAFTVTGNSLVNRPLVQSSVVGTARTITAASVSLTNCDLMDISAAGASTPWTGSSLGDAQGNSNGTITFTTPVTRYGVVAGNGSSTATWSTSSGGAGGASVPLPQDAMVLDANSAAGTYTMDMPRLGVSLTCTGFTRTLTTSVSPTIYGSVTLSSTMTFGTVGGWIFAGRSSCTITSAGQNGFTNTNNRMTIVAPGGTYTLQDAFAIANQILITNGTLNTNGMTVTTGTAGLGSGNAGIIDNGSAARSLVFGTSTIYLGAGGFSVTATGMTMSAASATFVFDRARTTSSSFTGAGFTYGTLTYTVANSPGPLVISNNGGTIGTLNVGSGRVWTNTQGTTCTFGAVNASGVSNGFFQVPAVAAAYASTPDAAAVDITGNITVEAQLAMVSWTTGIAYPESKWTGTAATSAYRLSMNAGKIVLDISAGGSIVTATSTVNVGFTAGATGWVAAQRVQSTGVVTFSTSPDGVTWTPLGTTVTIAAGTAINNAAQIVEFGTYNTGATASTVAFPLYRSRIWADVTRTTLALDADFATKTPCATSFTESSSNAATVTIIGAMAQAGDGSIVLNSSTPGTQATMTSSNTQALEFLIYQDSKVTGSTWYAGVSSNSVSNNTGWTAAGLRSGSENVGPSDTATRHLIFVRSGSESVGVSDTAVRSAAALVRAGTEAVTVADSATRAAQSQARTGAESAVVTDSASRSAIIQARTGAESIVVSDTAIRTPQSSVRVGSESVPIADTGIRAGQAQIRAGAENVAVGDTATRPPVSPARSGAENVAVGDSASRSGVGYARLGSETASVTDSASRGVWSFARSGAETIPVTDTATTSLVRGRFGSESVPLTDTATNGFTPAPPIFTLVSNGTLSLPWSRRASLRVPWKVGRLRV